MRRALALLEAAADGAADDDVTPAEISHEVDGAAGALPAGMTEARGLLEEARDALADGMPGEYVTRILYRALSLIPAN